MARIAQAELIGTGSLDEIEQRRGLGRQPKRPIRPSASKRARPAVALVVVFCLRSFARMARSESSSISFEPKSAGVFGEASDETVGDEDLLAADLGQRTFTVVGGYADDLRSTAFRAC